MNTQKMKINKLLKLGGIEVLQLYNSPYFEHAHNRELYIIAAAVLSFLVTGGCFALRKERGGRERTLQQLQLWSMDIQKSKENYYIVVRYRIDLILQENLFSNIPLTCPLKEGSHFQS